MDELIPVLKYLGVLSGLSAVVWACAEMFGGSCKKLWAAILGPALALFLWMLTFLPMLPTVFDVFDVADEPSQTRFIVNALWAMFSGLLATGGAKVLNDRIAKPLGLQKPPAPEV